MARFFERLVFGQMKHHLLMLCVFLWVFSQIGHAFSAESPVQKVASFGGVDIRSIAREPEEEAFLPVADRTFPDFVPRGLILGKFLVLPSVGVGGFHTDNLYATDSNEVSDSAAVITPALNVRTLKDKHFFGANLTSEIIRYFDNTNENVENFAVSFGGHHELKEGLLLPYEVSYERYHQGRSDNLSRVFTKKPLEISDFDVSAGVSYKPNRFGLKVLGRYIQKRFEDGVSLSDPTMQVVRSDSNFQTNQLEVSGSYEFPANHTAFVRGVYSDTTYDKGIFNDSAQSFTSTFRDAQSFNGLVGVSTKYKGLLLSDIGIGYAAVDFENRSLSDVENLALDASVDLNVTQLTSLGLSASRTITQDNEIIQGIVQTKGTLSVDHELRRQLVLNAYGTYLNRDFDGISREDDLYRVGLGFLYRPVPYYNIRGEYVYSTQDSTFSGKDFDRNLFMIRLTGQY